MSALTRGSRLSQPRHDLGKNGSGRIRVAHIIHALGAGGAESVLVDLARSCDAENIDMIVIGLSDAVDNRTVPILEAAGVTVYELHRRRYDARVIPILEDILERERIDVVHTHLKHADFFGNIAARRLGLPTCSTLHVIDGGQMTPAHRVRVRSAALARDLMARRVITLSEAQRAWYVSYAASRCPVVIVPNGVIEPVVTASTDEVRAELGIPEGVPFGLVVSLMRPEKGHAIALDAMKALPADVPFVLAFAGDGPLLDQVRARVDADPVLSERIRVLGFRRDVPNLLAACDVVIHPSLEDALPTALISSLAARKPIIASNIGGIPDIVGPGCGVLVPSGNPQAIVDALVPMLADNDARTAMGTAGRARYDERYSATVWARNLRQLYDEIRAEQASANAR